MANRDNYTGCFVAEYSRDGQTQTTLHNAKDPTGRELGSLRLLFQGDVERLILQGGVPLIYGIPMFLAFHAMIRGILRPDKHQETEMVLDSIDYLELVDESSEGLITYAFRMDGANFEQIDAATDFPHVAPVNDLPNRLLRIPCRYLYLPTLKKMTISSSKSAAPIVIPDQIIPQLLKRLPLDMGAAPDGTEIPVMSATGVIEGRIHSESDQREGLLIAPEVCTFNLGGTVHRLWLNRSSFRWWIDEHLVVPIQ